MKRKVLTLVGTVCLVLVLAPLSFMVACAEPAPAPAPAPTPAPAPAPAPTPPPAEVITLKFSTYTVPPPGWESAEIFEAGFMTPITVKTGGRVQWDTYYGAVLGSAIEQYDLILDGTADLAYCVPGYFPGRFPRSEIIDMPFSAPTMELQLETYYDLYKRGWFDEDWANAHLCFVYTTDFWGIHTKKKITKLEDLKGLKIRAMGPTQVAALEQWGATPVPMPGGDIYMSMERGVVDGMYWPTGMMHSWRFDEVTDYCFQIDAHTTIGTFLMNKDTWAALPDDIKQVFDEQFWPANMAGAAAWTKAHMNQIGRQKEYGLEVVYPSIAERERWIEAAMPVWDEWIAEKEAKGIPAQALADEWWAVLAEIMAE